MRVVALNGADAVSPALAIETDAGRLQGAWRGSTAIAQGETVDVELELPRPRSFGELIVDPSVSAASWMVSGVVAAVFDDGVIVLQIGTATLQIELEGASVSEIEGTTIGLEAEDLEFYPTGI